MKTLTLILFICGSLAFGQRSTTEEKSKPKPRLYMRPNSSYTAVFKDAFLNVCPAVEATSHSKGSNFQAEVGNVGLRFTWILEDAKGEVIARDARSSMEDAAVSLCREIKSAGV